MAIDHDRLAKELLSTFFVDFLDLFLPQVAMHVERDSLILLDKEVFTDVTSGETHEVDLVAQLKWRRRPPGVSDDAATFLIHVEAQAKTESEFAKRMFRYFARLHEKFDQPVYPIALFTFTAPQRAETDNYSVDLPELRVLQFKFRSIQLNRLNWRDFLRCENPVAAALMSQMKIAPDERAQVKIECLRLLATLRLDRAKMKLISGFIDTYLKLNASEEKRFQAVLQKELPEKEKENIMEIVTSWMEQGIERGIVQGQRQATVGVVLRQLDKRLGQIPQDLRTRISTAPLAEVEKLSEDLLEFKSLDDLKKWRLQN